MLEVKKNSCRMRLIAIFFLAMGFIGCVTTPRKFNHVSVGMTKAEVIGILGEPQSTSGNGQVEYLNYAYNMYPVGSFGQGGPDYRFVRIINGRVDAYGKPGDFDSTKDAVTKIKIEQSEGD